MSWQILIVDVLLVVSLSWSISRVFAGDNAWKPRFIDYFSDAVGFSSWVVGVAYSIQNNGISEISEEPLMSVIKLVAAIGMYVVLIYAFIRLRREVYQYRN